MVVGGLLIQAARRLREQVEAGDRRIVRGHVPGLRARSRRRPASTSASSRTPAARRSTTRRTPATPTRRSAGRRASPGSTSTWTPARSTSATSWPPTTSAGSSTRSWPRARSRAARCRPSATPRSRRSSCATAATSTTAWPRTSSRPRSMHPASAPILVEAPFPGAPHGVKGVGELPMDVGAPAVIAAIADATGVWITRPAGQPGAGPRRAGRRRRARAGLPPGRVRAAPRGARVTTYRFTVNGTEATVDVPGHAPPARRPARGPRPDRDQGGLRGRGVRRLHRAPRRRPGRQLPRPGLPGRRCRRSGRWRASPPRPRTRAQRAAGARPAAGGVPRDRWRPVRDLHAGHAHGRPGVP